MNSPVVLSLEQLRRREPSATVIWCVPEVCDAVSREFPFRVLPYPECPPGIRTVIVIGGGMLIDQAKVWRRDSERAVELVAIPSLWGSGAEASPFAVLNLEGRKHIRMDAGLLPDARAVWPELAQSMPRERARAGCGDVWAHALEGFLSPLADDGLRGELATLLGSMLKASRVDEPRWFEWSAQACAGQARASVGLVHGIAHTLEGVLAGTGQPGEWGHARLCALFVLPVMQFNAQTSSKWCELLGRYALPETAIFNALQSVGEPSAYSQVLQALVNNWPAVLRDRCTRTNCTLVRPNSLEFFQRWSPA